MPQSVLLPVHLSQSLQSHKACVPEKLTTSCASIRLSGNHSQELWSIRWPIQLLLQSKQVVSSVLRQIFPGTSTLTLEITYQIIAPLTLNAPVFECNPQLLVVQIKQTNQPLTPLVLVFRGIYIKVWNRVSFTLVRISTVSACDCI